MNQLPGFDPATLGLFYRPALHIVIILLLSWLAFKLSAKAIVLMRGFMLDRVDDKLEELKRIETMSRVFRYLTSVIITIVTGMLLLSELGLEILVAIPLGCVAGFWLAALILALMSPEVLEIPLVIFPTTYLYAAAIVAAAGVVSALIVRNRIDRLDLVGVLKTRE